MVNSCLFLLAFAEDKNSLMESYLSDFLSAGSKFCKGLKRMGAGDNGEGEDM